VGSDDETEIAGTLTVAEMVSVEPPEVTTVTGTWVTDDWVEAGRVSVTVKVCPPEVVTGTETVTAGTLKVAPFEVVMVAVGSGAVTVLGTSTVVVKVVVPPFAVVAVTVTLSGPEVDGTATTVEIVSTDPAELVVVKVTVSAGTVVMLPDGVTSWTVVTDETVGTSMVVVTVDEPPETVGTVMATVSGPAVKGAGTRVSTVVMWPDEVTSVTVTSTASTEKVAPWEVVTLRVCGAVAVGR
jgi:hypothetical protein